MVRTRDVDAPFSELSGISLRELLEVDFQSTTVDHLSIEAFVEGQTEGDVLPDSPSHDPRRLRTVGHSAVKPST